MLIRINTNKYVLIVINKEIKNVHMYQQGIKKAGYEDPLKIKKPQSKLYFLLISNKSNVSNKKGMITGAACFA